MERNANLPPVPVSPIVCKVDLDESLPLSLIYMLGLYITLLHFIFRFVHNKSEKNK